MYKWNKDIKGYRPHIVDSMDIKAQRINSKMSELTLFPMRFLDLPESHK
jgi:hypothetical protein